MTKLFKAIAAVMILVIASPFSVVGFIAAIMIGGFNYGSELAKGLYEQAIKED